mmetsp:Transcript_41135/g.41836  ORF Transcript_41135/g.41836 Transcript_41135/m.41836 type:complete len:166 (-) Transcript_41135:380-877(-)
MMGGNRRENNVLFLRSATIATYTLFLLLLVVAVPCNAFCITQSTLASDDSNRVQTRSDGRNMIVGMGSSTTTTTSSSSSRLFMAAPGFKSEAQRKQERDSEIRAKIAMLKREGKMKTTNKETGQEESQEDSTIKEAEAFFNKPSPLQKFAARQAERERKEKEEEE